MPCQRLDMNVIKVCKCLVLRENVTEFFGCLRFNDRKVGEPGNTAFSRLRIKHITQLGLAISIKLSKYIATKSSDVNKTAFLKTEDEDTTQPTSHYYLSGHWAVCAKINLNNLRHDDTTGKISQFRHLISKARVRHLLFSETLSIFNISTIM